MCKGGEDLKLEAKLFLWILIYSNIENLFFSAVNRAAVKHNSCQGQYVLGKISLLVNNQRYG